MRPQNAVATGRVPTADAGAACAYATGMLRGGSGGAAASGAMDVNAGLRSNASSGGSLSRPNASRPMDPMRHNPPGFLLCIPTLSKRSRGLDVAGTTHAFGRHRTESNAGGSGVVLTPSPIAVKPSGATGVHTYKEVRPVVISHNRRNATAVGSQRSRTAVTSTRLKRRAEIVKSLALVGFFLEP